MGCSVPLAATGCFKLAHFEEFIAIGWSQLFCFLCLHLHSLAFGSRSPAAKDLASKLYAEVVSPAFHSVSSLLDQCLEVIVIPNYSFKGYLVSNLSIVEVQQSPVSLTIDPT